MLVSNEGAVSAKSWRRPRPTATKGAQERGKQGRGNNFDRGVERGVQASIPASPLVKIEIEETEWKFVAEE